MLQLLCVAPSGGYTFLASPGEGHEILKSNVALQHSLGAQIDVFEGETAIQEQFPWVWHWFQAPGSLLTCVCETCVCDGMLVMYSDAE